MAVVYKITNKVTQDCYIGVTVDFSRRMREHAYKPNKLLGIDIIMYGWDSFSKEILVEAPEEVCYSLEESYIQKFNAKYNTAKGGWHSGAKVGEDHPMHVLKENDILNIRKLYLEGTHTQQKLAELFNTTNKHVSAIVTGTRWKHVHPEYISTDNNSRNTVANRSKLSEQDVVDIRVEYSLGGITIKDIAEIYSVARQNISKLLDGDSWGSMPGPIRGVDYKSRRNSGSSK